MSLLTQRRSMMAQVVQPPVVDPPTSSPSGWVGFDIGDDPGIPTPTGSGVTRYVSPSGASSGTGTNAGSRISIEHALSIAQPGDVIILGDGDYGSLWSGGDTSLSGTNHNTTNRPGARHYWGRVAGTAANPINIVGENAPTFVKNDVSQGAVFTGSRSNNNQVFYLGNMQYVNWSRFTSRRGQDALVIGTFTGRPAMGPLEDCNFTYFHLYESNQSSIVYKHDSARNVFDNYLMEDTNYWLEDINQVPAGRSADAINGNWPALNPDGSAWIPEANAGRSFVGIPFVGEGHYVGYNGASEMTGEGWDSVTGPGLLTCRRFTARRITGGELFDMKNVGSGDIVAEDFIYEDSTLMLSGAFNAERPGHTLYARRGVVRNFNQHWTCIYTPPVFNARLNGRAEAENIIFLDGGANMDIAGTTNEGVNHVVLRHCTKLNWPGPVSNNGGAAGGSTVTAIDCASLDGATGSWFGAVGAVDTTGPDYDNGTGRIGYGVRPNLGDNWATGGGQNPPADLEGTSRPASSALGALEPTV